VHTQIQIKAISRSYITLFDLWKLLFSIVAVLMFYRYDAVKYNVRFLCSVGKV